MLWIVHWHWLAVLAEMHTKKEQHVRLPSEESLLVIGRGHVAYMPNATKLLDVL